MQWRCHGDIGDFHVEANVLFSPFTNLRFGSVSIKLVISSPHCNFLAIFKALNLLRIAGYNGHFSSILLFYDTF